MHIQALEKAGRTDQLLQNEDLGMQVKEPFFTKRGAKWKVYLHYRQAGVEAFFIILYEILLTSADKGFNLCSIGQVITLVK